MGGKGIYKLADVWDCESLYFGIMSCIEGGDDKLLVKDEDDGKCWKKAILISF